MKTCRICNLEYPKTNKSFKDRCKKCYMKQYKQDNKERLKQYNQDNREKINQQRREWCAKNKQRVKKSRETHQSKKSNVISNWKKTGLLEYGYTYKELYEYYYECNNCEVCNKDLSTIHQKCMDHCHNDGCFRWVLCKSCNNRDYWMKNI
jgi:hypothetical protein